MAKGKRQIAEPKKKNNSWQKEEELVSDGNEDQGQPDGMEVESDDGELGEGILASFGGRSKEPKSVFAFDSASEESDDEKLLEERLRQFERVQFKDAVASDIEDDEEEDNEEEMANYSERPVRNKYGGNVDERFLEIVDDDGGEEPSAAILEEQEAKIIQQRLASMVSENDVNLELLGIPLNEQATDEKVKGAEGQDIAIEAVGAKASPHQMTYLVDKRYPELEPLISRVKEELKNLNSKWIPLVKLLDDKNNTQLRAKVGHSALMFARSKHLIGFSYCVNALFYLRLRARHEPVEGHPVAARLVSNHKLLEQLNSAERFFMKPGKRLDFLLTAHQRGASMDELVKGAEKHFGSKQLPSETVASSSRRPMPMTEANIDEKMDESEEDKTTEEFEKRKLSDKMAKTGGAPRSKSKRNPRVANRNRYTKALKRRKASGVREWQPPINAYGGELTGIRAGVRRSIKLKM